MKQEDFSMYEVNGKEKPGLAVIDGTNSISMSNEMIETDGDLFVQAVEYLLEKGSVSTSILQYKLRIGYARACQLMDGMVKLGILGARVGSRPQKCLITKKEWNKISSIFESGAVNVDLVRKGLGHMNNKESQHDGQEVTGINLREFVDRYNILARLLLHSFQGIRSGENVVFSPFSIISVLSVLSDASAGKTRQEIHNVLYGDLYQQGFPDQLKLARQVLEQEEPSSSRDLDFYFDSEGHIIPSFDKPLHTVNAICVREDYQETISPQFQAQLEEMYDGKMLFSSEAKAGLLSWIMRDIPVDIAREILSLLEEFLNSEHVMSLINAIAFDAVWKRPYEDNQIREGIFHNLDNTDSKVSMLHGYEGSFVENELAIGFMKPFKQYGYSFMALLPKEKGQGALSRLADTANFSELMDQRQYCGVHTVMPEMDISAQYDLNKVCEQLGIREIYNKTADFQPMSSSVPLYVDKMIHKAKINLNKKGVKAVSVTMTMVLGSCGPSRKEYVTLDRPFVFAVLNNELKIPVFIGVCKKFDHKG